MNKNSFYITTTIPYVNADPHIGFALELVQSDAIARYQRLAGREVFFSTGTDEHGQKIWQASQAKGERVEEYVDHYAKEFRGLREMLNLSYDNFIRTTSEGHIKAAQEFWRLCDQRGDIYKKKYQGLYCVGCEKFITEKDLADGKCPVHPTLTPEVVEEENYFFRLSKYRDELLKYLKKEKSIIPEWRREEAIDFALNAMEDFSISRSRERFAWGIPVPMDETQVMYVWFDALVNYISTLGWPKTPSAAGHSPLAGGENLFQKFWIDGYTVQTAGKDMVKFQSVMWQGMLMSAGLPNTDSIIYHGFITGEGGIKMSKSIGNVINPAEIVKDYGTDALRYFLLREISTYEDSPFTMERFKEAYNSGLANGLGNLTSRIMKMAVSNAITLEKEPEFLPQEERLNQHLNEYNFNKAVEEVASYATYLDAYIQTEEPFKKIKTNPDKARKDIEQLLGSLYRVGRMLTPVLPHTSQKIIKLVKENRMPEQPLFPRKD